jgi:hypothetical protein
MLFCLSANLLICLSARTYLLICFRQSAHLLKLICLAAFASLHICSNSVYLLLPICLSAYASLLLFVPCHTTHTVCSNYVYLHTPVSLYIPCHITHTICSNSVYQLMPVSLYIPCQTTHTACVYRSYMWGFAPFLHYAYLLSPVRKLDVVDIFSMLPVPKLLTTSL